MKKSLGADTLIYPTPTWLVGTYDAAGKANLMAVAWGGVCCSKPPCVTVSLRKATYSYQAIVERKAFTVGVPSADQVREADYCGIASGRKTDKFADCRFTPVRSTLVDAPYAEEFPMVLECRLRETLEIGLHTLFVGEILDVKAEESVLGPDGLPEIDKVRPFVFTPRRRTYHAVGEMLGKAFEIGKDIPTR
ncbi:MAG: flavin reductase family protein [Pirellulales bacterium]|nr:flavin reductase family protein [Pirellulales bacterium]